MCRLDQGTYLEIRNRAVINTGKLEGTKGRKVVPILTPPRAVTKSLLTKL